MIYFSSQSCNTTISELSIVGNHRDAGNLEGNLTQITSLWKNVKPRMENNPASSGEENPSRMLRCENFIPWNEIIICHLKILWCLNQTLTGLCAFFVSGCECACSWFGAADHNESRFYGQGELLPVHSSKGEMHLLLLERDSLLMPCRVQPVKYRGSEVVTLAES